MRSVILCRSSKYGTATPVVGHGPTFTVQFDDTFGPHGETGEPFEWLGARADNALFGQDQKMIVFVDEFDVDGDPNPAIYKPLFGATLEVSAGNLVVTPNPKSSEAGVRICNPLPQPPPVSSRNQVEAWRYDIDFTPTFSDPVLGNMTMATVGIDDKIIDISTYDNSTDTIFVSEGDRFGGIQTIAVSSFQPNVMVKEEKKHKCKYLLYWKSPKCCWFLILGYWKFGEFGDAPYDSTLNDLALKGIELVSTEGFTVSRVEIVSGDEVGGVQEWTISPSHVRTAGGETITISGQGFDSLGPFTLNVGGTTVDSATVVDDSTITFVSPAKLQGLTEVRLVPDNGVVVIFDNDFRYYASATPLLLQQGALPTAFQAVPYSGDILATGGTAPYTFNLASGNLPNGLSLGSDGSLGGTPNESGVFVFFVQVLDSMDDEDVRTFFLEVEEVE